MLLRRLAIVANGAVNLLSHPSLTGTNSGSGISGSTAWHNSGFQAMVERAGEAAGFDVKIHPHMLRHACSFKLANDGVDTRTIQAYLGHKSIQHTVCYTELAPTRFKSLFRE